MGRSEKPSNSCSLAGRRVGWREGGRRAVCHHANQGQVQEVGPQVRSPARHASRGPASHATMLHQPLEFRFLSNYYSKYYRSSGFSRIQLRLLSYSKYHYSWGFRKFKIKLPLQLRFLNSKYHYNSGFSQIKIQNTTVNQGSLIFKLPL